VEELSILNDLAREISASNKSNEIIRKVVSRSIHAIHAEQGLITLIETPVSPTQKTLARSIQTDVNQVALHLDQILLGWMQLHKRPLSLNQSQMAEQFKHITWDPNIRSLICVPLFVKSELIGILIAFNKKGGDAFTEDDQRLLTIIAAQSAQVIENARLLEHEQTLIAMREELRLAREIQAELLPKTDPIIEGYDIAGTSIPAHMVGGDYYDFMTIPDGRTVICLGDASGKGISAALLMSSLQAMVRAQLLDHCSPSECLRRTNYLLFQNTASNKFATLFFGILDPVQHTFLYSNAGHEPPIVIRKESVASELSMGELGLGIRKETSYSEKQLQLAPGEVVVIISDGVTEAMNNEGEEFGHDRLRQLLLSHADHSAQELIECIVREVNAFSDSKNIHDDMTLVILKRM
jgi:sigma-B regulation protein RsbU (phosphoserine phosphatase)